MPRNRTITGQHRGEAAGAGTPGKRHRPASEPVKSATVRKGRPVPDRDAGRQSPAPAVVGVPAAALVPPVRLETPSSPVGGLSGHPNAWPDVAIDVTLIHGGLTNVKAPVAIGARYEGLAVAGSTKAFDWILDSWLTRAIDLGMIGSGLGQLFPINLQHLHEAGKLNVDYLLLAGMGEPGGFAADDLRYLMSNVTVAVKNMSYDHVCTSLFGTRRNELTISEAVRAFVMGILDGYERFRAIVVDVRDWQERLRKAGTDPLRVSLVVADAEKLEQICKAFDMFSGENLTSGLRLTVTQGEGVDPDPIPEHNATDTDADAPVTFLRVTRKIAPVSAAPAPASAMGRTTTFEFSALSESSSVPVREEEISAYLIQALAARMTTTSAAEQRERLGRFFADLVLPEDFRKLTEGAKNLTLEVDETTAMYPWEMMAHKKYSQTSFLANSVGVSRQFRSLLAPRPSSPPPLNDSLKVLVIADPAPEKLSLPYALEEGFSVLEILDRARRAWRGQYEIQVTVRIGSRADQSAAARVEELRKQREWIVSAEVCDPLDIAMLVVSEQYDLYPLCWPWFRRPTLGPGRVGARQGLLPVGTGDLSRPSGSPPGLCQCLLFLRDGRDVALGRPWRAAKAAGRRCKSVFCSWHTEFHRHRMASR